MTYDRSAASRILAGLAHPDPFGAEPVAPGPRRIAYAATPLTLEPGARLTLSQRLYLERFMRPCRPEQVTTATHRLSWTDSAGIPNTGHCGPSDLGPVVPIAARETTLLLWHALATNPALHRRIAALSQGERAILAGTTTDHDPVDILRVGIEATGRALAQHALIADQTPCRTPADFAVAMRESGLFLAVATRWYWELQASTYRRGMIPVRLTPALHYPSETATLLRAMKDTTIADAHAVMRRATGEEGLTVEQAVQRYHHDLDLISQQYALLAEGAAPRCLAAMTHDLDGRRYTLLPAVVERFVTTFVAVVQTCTIVEQPSDVDDDAVGADERFFVPDMNCKHCTVTIRAVLESMGVPVERVDLLSKEVVAGFRSPRNRRRAMDAIRDSGYNPVDERP